MEDEETLFAAFEKAPEFFAALTLFLAADLAREATPAQDRAEVELLHTLIHIMDEYQEQIYLLDPFLERMVTPVVEVFKAHAVQYTAALRAGTPAACSAPRVWRLTHLLYTFVKSRGRKTIGKPLNFFPHQVADLPTALAYLSAPAGPAQIANQWQLRYLVVLWLSLICMIPFDLSKFDASARRGGGAQPPTAQQLDALAGGYLSQAGLEREASVVLLTKLYTRKDAAALLDAFVAGSVAFLGAAPDMSRAIGILHVFCELTKSGIPDEVARHVAGMRRALAIIAGDPRLVNNTIVRKLNVKLEGRLAVGVIPSARQTVRRVRPLKSDLDTQDHGEMPEDDVNDIDIPEEVEHGISTILECLQDKDTTVRYAASKHLARISSRLPLYLTEQVLENVLQLFSVHSSPSGAIEELPAVAEATWHGACLACAEMARRGLIPGHYLPQLLEWLKKALLFDIRKGAHSVGSGVRDAASYVLWALARSHDAAALTPHARALAQRLVAVSLYDREVHIRRAASAAFQENVGRMNVFPHGIDVLRKTDFFAVGVRKNAFLVAAPQVAEHTEYRLALIDHLINHTLVHWDPSMRELSAQSLRAVCELDLQNLGPKAEERVVPLLQSVDVNNVHGGLLGLSELASSYEANGNLEGERLKIFKSLARLPSSMLQKHHQGKILEATCLLIANSISLSAIRLDPSPDSRWRTVVEQAMRHRETDVQDAAACAMRSCSKLVDCSSDIRLSQCLIFVCTYAKDFPRGTPAVQQSLARTLGVLAYDQHDHAVHEALACLLDGVDRSSSAFSSNVEARRNCYSAMTELLRILDSKIPQVLVPSTVERVLRACILGLEDYTTDERGDVGSWIRVACIRGLCAIVEALFDLAPSLERHGYPLQEWISHETYQEVLGGILKQGVERLDNVRRQAGESFLRLLRRGAPKVGAAGGWQVQGGALVKQLLLSDVEDVGWNEGQWLFPKAVRFLEIPAYRKPVLHGLVLSIASRTDSTQRPVSMSFTTFTGSLPVSTGGAGDLDLLTITNELLEMSRKHLSSNQVVIPVLQTFHLILDAGALEKLAENEAGVQALNTIVDVSTRNLARMKSIQRILTSMKLINGMLAVPCVAERAIATLSQFLLHAFPKVRSDAAEDLYLVMQAKDLGMETDEAEEILLETDWSTSVDELEPKVDKLVFVLGSGVNK